MTGAFDRQDGSLEAGSPSLILNMGSITARSRRPEAALRGAVSGACVGTLISVILQ